MENYTDLKIGDRIYHIAVNCLTKTCEIQPQKIDYIGKDLIVANGIDPQFQIDGDTVFYFQQRDKLDKKRAVETGMADVWTSDPDKAIKYRSEINELLEIKKRISA